MVNIYPILVIFGWLLIILLGSQLCRKFFPNEKELSRKLVHIGCGPIILFAWFFHLSSNLVITVSCLITIFLFINYKLHLLQSLEDIGRKSFGTIAYGVSISFLNILFWSTNPSVVVIGVLVMSFGDGLAGLIGRKIQSPSWIILNQKKSLVGTIVMGVTTIIILFFGNQIFNTYLTSIDIFIITSLAVLLEQISPLGIDNITVPVGVGLIWYWILFT